MTATELITYGWGIVLAVILLAHWSRKLKKWRIDMNIEIDDNTLIGIVFLITVVAMVIIAIVSL